MSVRTERDAEQLLLMQPQAGSRTTSSYSSQPWFHLITWNIDMKAPYGTLRMRRALSHLHRDLLASLPPAEPVVIFFQEMTAADIALICGTQWVRERFFVTDVDVRRWSGRSYGTVTLVDRRMVISGEREGNGGWGVFRVPFVSRCGRDGLFVDIVLSSLFMQNSIAPPLSPPPSSSMSQQTLTKFFRLCNTHLESLSANPPVRPRQMESVAKYLHDSSLNGSLLAGDLNAIEPFDATFPSTYNLSDAYLVLGGEEGADKGFTWGYQSLARLRKKYGCNRMDKVLYCGEVKVRGLERVGVGVKLGDELWVTDHYGLHARVEVIGGYGVMMLIG